MRYPVALIATLGMVVGTASGAAAMGSSVETSHAGQVPSAGYVVVTEEEEFFDDIDLGEYYVDEGEVGDFEVVYVDEEGEFEEVGDYAEYDEEYAEDGEDFYYEEEDADFDEFGIEISDQRGPSYLPPKPGDPCKGKGYACRPKPNPCRDKCDSRPSRPKPGRPSPAKSHPVTGSAFALYGVGGALLTAVGGTVIVSQKRRKLEEA